MQLDGSFELDDSIFSNSENLGIKRVTIQDLRKCKGYEEIPDDEAIQIIETLFQLSLLTLRINQNETRSI